MSSDIIESLNQLRLANTGCDVVLQIGPKSFLAHRVVLMARLEYFRNMLTADMKEKKELAIPLDSLIIDSTIFEEFLNYIYTSKIDFTNENIRAIYRAADYFCFDELTNKVKEHLKSTMKVENVVFYKTVAVEFGLETLEEDCHQFVIQNLSFEMNREQLIPTLLFDDLKEVLQKLKQTGKLEEMFHYSVDWIAHHKQNSTDKLLELLKNIPLESLSFDFLKQVVSQNDLIRKDIECLNLFLDAFIKVSEVHEKETKENLKISVNKLNAVMKESDSKLKETNRVHAEKLNAVMKESDSRLKEVNRLNEIIKKSRESLYAIGGCDGERLSSVSQYTSTSGEWSFTTPMPSERSHFGCAVMGHKIYVCGGWNGPTNMNELTAFDTDTQRWTQLTPMKHARQLCAAAVLNGQIYVAGGWNGTDRLAVVERYNVHTDQWSEIAPMTTKRQELELVALNGFLYAIGGWDGKYAMNSVERYDPRTDKWTQMKNTIHKYNSFGSAVWNGFIYIVSGDKCEVYSLADDKWTEMPAPSICGLGRRLAMYNGKLYAIGGIVGEIKDWKGIKTVEVFDMQARVWRKEQDMDIARVFHELAVVQN